MGSSEEPSLQIIAKLTIILIGFYALYFGVSSLLAVLFDVEIDGRMPFDFENFDPAEEKMLPGWLSCVITYLLSIALIFFVVKSSARTWDYAWSLTILHWVVCMGVMGDFPTNWIWWVTIIVLTIAMGFAGWMANMWRENRTPSPIKPMGA